MTVRASHRTASQRFYDTVLGTLGMTAHRAGERHSEWGDFRLAPAEPGGPVTCGLHVGFVASSRERVDEFWRAGRAAGYRDDGAPGPRPQYREDYNGTYLHEPDANTNEPVHHGAHRDGG